MSCLLSLYFGGLNYRGSIVCTISFTAIHLILMLVVFSMHVAIDCDDIECSGNARCKMVVSESESSEEEECQCNTGFNSSASCEGI